MWLKSGVWFHREIIAESVSDITRIQENATQSATEEDDNDAVVDDVNKSASTEASSKTSKWKSGWTKECGCNRACFSVSSLSKIRYSIGLITGFIKIKQFLICICAIAS